ncbi:MAG: alpha/beta fold hydrolase [Gammaproteobacteria bacterium]
MSKSLLHISRAIGLMVCLSQIASAQPPAVPGRLVDVGGYRLHIHCTGMKARGTPTIVFDSGTGGFSLEWSGIQQALSGRYRVCAYDRAGYGWSEYGPLPRTSKRIANELNTLLTNSHTPGPYVLVGHSFGGYTAQYFAREYPQRTAAIVLIDSSHPEQTLRLPEPKQIPRRTHSRNDRSYHNARSYTVSKPILHKNYPQAVAELAWLMLSTRKHTRTWREEMMSLPISGVELSHAGPIPADIPVIVITRGKRVWPETERGNEMERIWMELQDELSTFGGRPVHLIAEGSGHSIHLDQPVYIINALDVLFDGF